MRLILNVIWFVLGGLWLALGYTCTPISPRPPLTLAGG